MKDGHKVNEQLFNSLVEVHSGVLVLQLNDKHDGQGMKQLAELLRERIAETNSSVVVVDATHVPNNGNKIEKHLIDIIRALRLLGTRVLLARRDHSIDRRPTRLGVDLSDITMCCSLAAGLWMALDIVESEAVNKSNRGEITRGEGKTKDQSMKELVKIRQLAAK